MSSRLTSAIVLGLAIIASPLGASSALAAGQTPPVATAASLQVVISGAAQAAAAKPGFRALSPQAKLAAIQAAVAEALSETGASSTVIAAALVQAVASNTISAGVAISVASAVAPETAQQVASNPVVTQQLAATGQSATVTATASTDNSAPVSVLVSLQGAAAPGGGADATATTTTQPAPYDPCAGVIAAYCGS
jgi:hypothetical protein